MPLQDLFDANVTYTIDTITKTVMTAIPPKGETWTKDEFVRKNQVLTDQSGKRWSAVPDTPELVDVKCEGERVVYAGLRF